MNDNVSRQLAASLGIGSIVFGVAPLALPRQVAWLFGITETDPAVLTLTRSIGIRDAVIGAGLWSAAVHGGKYRPWLLARALSDSVDAISVALAVRAGRRDPRFVGIGIIAAVAAVYGLSLLTAARSETSEESAAERTSAA